MKLESKCSLHKVAEHLRTGGRDGAAMLPLHIEASHQGARALAKDVLDRHDAVLTWDNLFQNMIIGGQLGCGALCDG